MTAKTKKKTVAAKVDCIWVHTVGNQALQTARENLQLAGLDHKMWVAYHELCKAKKLQTGRILRDAARDLKRLEQVKVKEKNA